MKTTVPSFRDAYVSIFHYLPTLLTAPSIPPPRSLLHGSDASFNHYTKSAFMHTTPFSLCSLALTDTRGPSERISTVFLTAFHRGYINKMPAPPASANHYPDTLCTDYSYRQWGMNINYSLSLRHQTGRMWSDGGLIVGDQEWILCYQKKKKSLITLQKAHFTLHGAASTAEVQLLRVPARRLLPHVQLSLLKTWGN